MKATLVFGAFLAAVLIASPVLAKTVTPINGVPIGLEGDPGSVVVSQTKTNSAGVAVFQNVKPGKYRLIFDRWGSASDCPCVAVIEITVPGQARVVQTISETAIGSMKTVDQHLVPFIVERTKLQSVTVTITHGSGSNKESK